MLKYPHIDPTIVSLGPIHIRWYGLMYVIGFTAAYLLVAYQAKKFSWRALLEKLDNLNLALVLGVILGGRLGYVLIYNPAYYFAHPLQIPATWTGGMSFHGACVGALVAGALYCRKTALDYWKAADLFVVTVPIGLFFGRIGNFINGELYGRISSVPWAMIFPEGGPLPRHPSQLYEALFEGGLLYCLLWTNKHKPWHNQANWPHGSLLAIFLSGYGFVRFFIEFFREPDEQVGYVLWHLTMGQIWCFAMVCSGVGLWLWRKRAQTD